MRGFVPALRSSAYGCRLSETHRTRRLRLLGSPPDLVHSGSIVQDPHPYAEPRRRRCPTHSSECQNIVPQMRADFKREKKGTPEASTDASGVLMIQFKSDARDQDWQAVIRLIL